MQAFYNYFMNVCLALNSNKNRRTESLPYGGICQSAIVFNSFSF